MLSQYFFHLALKVYAREITRAAYTGILQRDADEGGLDAYAREIGKTGDLAAILGDITASREAWVKHFYDHPEEAVRIVFRGLLDREPEPEALTHYAGLLVESKDLPTILSMVGQSQEYWKKLLEQKSDELVRVISRGLLNREPTTEELENYASKLAETRDLSSLLVNIVHTKEFFDRTFSALAPDLIRAVYSGLLGREADPVGLSDYTKILLDKKDLSPILSAMVKSDEFSRLRPRTRLWPDPATTYDSAAVVHLHIQKTAGSSINRLLGDAYEHKGLCFVNDDAIYLRSPGELSTYSIFAGHLNYDSLSYIPRRMLLIVTFVRQPKKRLISLYQYWRSHEPDHKDSHQYTRLANQMIIGPFFKEDRVRMIPAVWNHMTWAIMGQRQWRQWQKLLTGACEERRKEELINTTMRAAIRERLKQLAFIGILEDFDRSVDMLFAILGRPRPRAAVVENSLESRIVTDPKFKKVIEKQEITSHVDAALDRLVQLDNVVYEEAKILFAERLEHNAKIENATGKSRKKG